MAGVWTNNWNNMRRSMAAGIASTDLGVVYNTSGNAISSANVFYSQYPVAGPMSPLHGGRGSGGQGVVGVPFGTSDTTPAVTNNYLGEAFTSGLSYVDAVNGTETYNASTGVATRTDYVTVMNTAGEDKIVREWGIVGRLNGADVLLYRAVLDVPITLPQYYSLKLTITRTMQLEVLE